MSLSEFLPGLLNVALIACLTGFVAYRLRARLMPGFTGAPGRLVELVVAVATLVISAELLGLFGALGTLPLLVLIGLQAVAAWLWLLPRPVRPDDPVPPEPAVSGFGQAIAFLVVFTVVAQWGAFTSYNLDHGITNFDSVWYHLPFAAEIANSGAVTGFHHAETVFLNWFYPQNSELIHAIAMVLIGGDYLSIFVNLGWLAFGLLAGWCVGRPYDRPHLTMLAVAVLMATHTLVVREPGTGKNDIMAAVLVLAAVAIMLNRSSSGREPKGRVTPDWAMVSGGLAIGLAAGTKVTALAPALLICGAVLFATVKGQRLRAAPVLLLPALAGGGWWYFRNLIHAGNPLPQLTSIGPINLPGPDRLQIGRPDFAVAHYLTDTEVWQDYFVPGLDQGFGHIWPLLLVTVILGLGLVMVKAPGRLTRTHGLVALLAILAYLVTPLGAAGPEGDPTAFSINLRFLIPALGLAIVIVPLATSFDRGWPRVLLGLLLVALFLGASQTDPVISAPGRNFGLFLALLFVALPALGWFFRERLGRHLGVPPLAVAFGLTLALFALLSWPLQRAYLDNRYGDFEPEAGLADVYRWAEGISDSRIALAGTTAGFKQYGFYGPDLSNEVTYLGQDAPHGGFDAIGRCEGFARAVNEADPDYLVTAPFLNFNDYEHPIASPETRWAANDPALEAVVPAAKPLSGDRPVVVWRVRGALDPALCGRLGSGSDFIPGLAEK